MKVSFSRKGFDSSCGGQANAILPDGTLLPFLFPVMMAIHIPMIPFIMVNRVSMTFWQN